MTADAVESLVTLARGLTPVVRDGAAEADRERRLSQRVARAMAEAGLYRTATSRVWNGHEADPHTAVRAIEAVAEADGAAGWNLMIALDAGGLTSGAATDEAAREIFLADPQVIVAGTLPAHGRARPVAGGWLLSGQWPFASGCHNASWMCCGALITDEDGAEIVRDAAGNRATRQFLIPAGEFEILDTWHVAGLRGSGSHDVRVRDLFIPEHRVIDLYGAGMRQRTPLFRYPFMPRICYPKAGVATGIARAALDAFLELAGSKTPYRSQTLLAEKAHAQLAIAEAEATLGAGRAFLFETMAEMWALVCAGGEPSERLRVRHRLAAAHCVESAVRAVELVHRSAGTSANVLSSPIERAFRDVHVVRQQVTVQPAVFELAGRALLGAGLEPGMF
jgi:alkylation response protein AidB-like acyl-CoA dehydrogenase